MADRSLPLAACLALAACAHVNDESLLLRDDLSFDPVASLTPAQVRADIDVLVYALDRGYGGRRFVPAAAFDAAVRGLRAIRPAGAIYGSAELCRDIDRQLVTIPDNHLMARFNRLCSPEREKLFAPGGVGKNVGADGNKAWSVVEKKAGDTVVPVLSITSMPSHEDDAWKGFEAAVVRMVETAPAIIVDLRGNGGGDDSLGHSLAAYLFGQDAPSPLEARIIRRTAATIAMQYNQPAFRILDRQAHGETVPDWLVKRRLDQLERYRRARRGELPPEETVTADANAPYDAAKGYRHPVFVLIDRGCASSCESTLEALETHPWVTTVGENTGGFVQFGNLGLLVLPNSHVRVQIASDYWKFRDNRAVDRVGYAPKVRVAAGTDALDEALRLVAAAAPR